VLGRQEQAPLPDSQGPHVPSPNEDRKTILLYTLGRNPLMHDVKNVFVRLRQRIANLLQVCYQSMSGQYHSNQMVER
jgi:hypothetical protein